MKIQAIVLDWAGTTVDYGSRAPVAVLEEVFALHNVPLGRHEARAFMGLLKVDHIRATLGIPAVRERWTKQHGAPPGEPAVQHLFAEFIPRQLSCLESYSDLIPGVVEAVERFRARGIRIGSSTGYTRPMLDLLIDKAAQQGYRPDASVVPDEVGAGRPAPFMCFLNAVKLQAYPLSACVKIGDTPSDIEEGKNAGMWTIGIAKTGNEVGLTETEFQTLPKEEAESLLMRARKRLSQADFIVDSLAECYPILDQIESHLR